MGHFVQKSDKKVVKSGRISRTYVRIAPNNANKLNWIEDDFIAKTIICDPSIAWGLGC